MLDRHVSRIVAMRDLAEGEPICGDDVAFFMAPLGTPAPAPADLLDGDGPWKLVHPRVPDAPSELLGAVVPDAPED